MNRTLVIGTLLAAASFSLAGCWGGRYVSADADLESIYLGKSYYEVVDEFGRPDASVNDDRGGTIVYYDAANLQGTSAATLYSRYTVRNRSTKEVGTPSGNIAFSFTTGLKCYAVESNLQRQRVKQVVPKKAKWEDPTQPYSIKPIVPRTLDFPNVERRSPYAEVVSIEKIEIEKNQTKIYFSYCDRTPKHRPLYDKGLAINKEVFLQDCATGERVKFVKAEGITVYPEYTDFAHNRGGYDMLVYSLIFEALPFETEVIDIVEPGPEGFNFYGVDVRTPMSFVQSKKANPVAPSKPIEEESTEEQQKKNDK